MNDALPVSGDEPLSFSISQGPGCAVVSVAGEIDMSTERAFRDGLAAVLARGAVRVVVDLAGVTFMSSSGIAVLLGTRRVLAEQGGLLVLAAPRGEVAQVLSLTGVGGMIPVAASVADAVACWDA